jgi:hypothetical protein
MNKKLDDFTKSLFDQAKALVPKEILADFAERFEKRSEFVFPILLFFYFAKKNIRRIKEKEEVILQLCKLEMIDGRKTYRLFLPESGVWMVLTFGYQLQGLISERSVCHLGIYENTPHLDRIMGKERVNLLETRWMLAIFGNQSIETVPGCGLTLQRIELRSDTEVHLKAMNFITELLYAFTVLRSTSKVYKVKPPIAGTELSASYEEKKIEEVKH